MNKYFVFFTFIIILASVLRLWQLGTVPISPDWDEAALGYNAYSVLHTGKDEYGKFLPIILRSFDDYKPALYMYLIVPLLPIFGLTVIAVRLPSALFGIGAVIAVYFLVKEILTVSKFSEEKTKITALTASLLLAISPWHIQFSRIAFESNVGTALNLFGVLFFLKGLRNKLLLLLSMIIFSINIYMYQSEKVFTPLLVFVLIILFKNDLLKIPKKILIAIVICGLIIALPMIVTTATNKEALARAQGVSVFADTTPLLKQSTHRLERDRQSNNYIGLLLDNRRIIYLKSVISGYLSHFDFNWLFITGDIARHHAPNMGMLYLWELPFLLIGIYMVVFESLHKKVKILLVLWLLLVPIPASVTSGVPHAVRTLNFLPLFQIFTSFGIVYMWCLLKRSKKYIALPTLGLGLLLISLNILYYLNQYFVQQNIYNSKEWQYGYKEAVSEVKKFEGNYEKIVVSNRPHLDQSYIFFLFYLQYSPKDYQQNFKTQSGGFRENHQFGKYEFRPIEYDKEPKDKKILYIGRPTDIPKNVRVIKTIKFLNKEDAIKIAEF